MKLVFPEQSIFWSKAWNLGFGVIIAALFIPIGVKLYPMLGGRIAMNPAYSLSLSIFMILIVAANIRLIVKFPTLLVYCGIFVFSMIIVTLLRSSLSPNVLALKYLLYYSIPILGVGIAAVFLQKKVNVYQISFYPMVFLLASFMLLSLLVSWSHTIAILPSNLNSVMPNILSLAKMNLEYVPVVIISAFGLTLFNNFHSRIRRTLLVGLSYLLAIYTAASISISAFILFSTVIITFYFFARRQQVGLKFNVLLLLSLVVMLMYFFGCSFWSHQLDRYDIALFMLFLAVVVAFYFFARKQGISLKFCMLLLFLGLVFALMYFFGRSLWSHQPGQYNISLPFRAKFPEIFGSLNMKNLPPWAKGSLYGRLYYWKIYISKPFESVSNFFVGMGPILNKKYPSAHNFYLELFNFYGIFPLMLFLFAVFKTVKKVIQLRKKGNF